MTYSLPGDFVQTKFISMLGIFISLALALVLALVIGLAGSVGGEVMISPLPLFIACGVLAFLIQWLAFVPAYLVQTLLNPGWGNGLSAQSNDCQTAAVIAQVVYCGAYIGC